MFFTKFGKCFITAISAFSFSFRFSQEVKNCFERFGLVTEEKQQDYA